MRILVLLALLTALLPERLRWRAGAASCCQEACACAAPEATSCCADEDAGPVLVAACDCGVPHVPGEFHRVHFEWFHAPTQEPLLPPKTMRHGVIRSELPRSHVEAPEPPPPRRAT